MSTQRFYAPVEIGPSRRRTPEGFLICEGVRLARTGQLLYGASELPMLTPDQAGLITVQRDPEEVFKPEAMTSAEGKTFVDDHPDEDVTPDNWAQLARGHLQNVRRGEGADDMYLVGDLVVKSREAIAALDSGKREISLGYDAEYEQLAPGVARQKNIVVNHVALVDKGRCGSACSIGDAAMTVKPRTFGEWLALFGRTTDAAARTKMLDEEFPNSPGEGLQTIILPQIGGEMKAGVTADEVRQICTDAMRDAFKARDEEEEKRKTEDAARRRSRDEDREDDERERTDDEEGEGKEETGRERSERTGDSAMQALRANCEILSPGFRIPTMDAKLDPAARAERVCDCKRRALAQAYTRDDGKAAIDVFLVGKTKDFSRLRASTIDLAFDGAAALLASRNNGQFRDLATPILPGQQPNKTLTPAELNKNNREFWSKRDAAHTGFN